MRAKLLLLTLILSICSTLAAAQQFPGLSGGSVGSLGDFSGSAGRVLELGTSLLGDPQPLIVLGTDTGLPLVQGTVPLLGVLTDAPASLPDYFSGGGTVLNSSLAAIPDIPLLSAPLEGL